MLNLKDVVDFILREDTGNAWMVKNFAGVADELLTYQYAVVEEKGEIVGVATASLQDDMSVKVFNVYTKQPKVLLKLLENFSHRFPFHSIKAYRQNKQKEVTYLWKDIQKMRRRLSYES